MKVAKSISIDEDLVFEIQHKAREEGLSFSVFIVSCIKKGLISDDPENEKNKKDKINLLNNNLILLNNNLLLKKKELFEQINEKIAEDEKELLRLNNIKKEKEQKLIAAISEIEDKIPKEVRKELLNLNMEDITEAFSQFMEIKTKEGLKVSLEMVHKYQQLIEQAKESKK